MRDVSRVVVAGALALGLAAGCANQTRTVKTERTVQSPAETAQRSPERLVVVEKSTTTETRHEPSGVLSTMIHVVGHILALPFHLIGGLLRLVF